MHDLETIFKWKVNLLIHGCRVEANPTFPSTTALKKIHLYAHSDQKSSQPIPDDLLLPGDMIVRIRYQPNSEYVLKSTPEGYHLLNDLTGETLPVELVKSPKCKDVEVAGTKISSHCSFLGTDLLGIIPSNYCFYFQQGKQCRFCEILPTFKKDIDYRSSFKKLDVVENSILTALQCEERFRFVAITTGNIHSYDATVEYYQQIGQRLQANPIFKQAEQVLATLMPPDDLSKISLLHQSGFNKIYFPLEIYEETHFNIVCPGKKDYGYDKILKALDVALKIFGAGNVYTNFVYGIQSLNSALDSASYDPQRENDLSLNAVKGMLSRGIIPAFTLYHYAGYNSIGNLILDTRHTESFFKEWGKLVRDAKIVPKDQDAVLFGTRSLSNTLFNDGFRLYPKRD